METVPVAEDEQATNGNEACTLYIDCMIRHYVKISFPKQLLHVHVCYIMPHYLTFSLVSMQVEQAIACLVDIAKHGKTAAAKYREDAPNAECKKMAEAYFMQG